MAIVDFVPQHVKDALLAECRLGGGVPNVQTIQSRFVEPVMGEINEATGQENNPRYVAYALLLWVVVALKATNN